VVHACVLVALVGLTGAEVPKTEEPAVIEIGKRRQLFVDRLLVEKLTRTRLVLNRPKDEGPVLRFDKPWEGLFAGVCTVIKDGDTYRLYYRGLPKAGGDGSNLEVTCYAESRDGIKWVKPDVGLFEVAGTRKNNVVLAGQPPFSHNFSPFLDTRPGVAESERYKALAGKKHGRVGKGVKADGLAAFVSADGIHWKPKQRAVLTKGAFDSQNVAFWSAGEQKYICYFRTWTGSRPGSGFRTVSRATSDDFITWADPQPMRFSSGRPEHIYTNQTHPYFRAPHIYVALAARFMPGRQVVSDAEARRLGVDPKYYRDCSDGVLMTSRGGDLYDRTFMESFVRPGIGLQNWVSRANHPALNVVQTSPTEMSIYVSQDYAQPTAHLRRYSLRLDGFASVHAPYAGGELLTKPLVFKGSRLLLNFATSAAGGIRVEIQDAKGRPIPGHSLRHARELIGNEIDREVSWRGVGDVSGLAGKTIRLRFVMKDADLYAMQFSGPARPE